jgi:acetolactate synthase I/III small subunit
MENGEMENEKKEIAIIATIVENKPGVLHSVSNMFRRRDFNIDSISVGLAEQKGLSRMTISVKGDKKTIDQVVKQLKKIVEVVKVSQLDPKSMVSRELALIKVNVSDGKSRSEIINFVDVFRSRIVDIASDSLMVEITGTPDKIDAFLNLMSTFGIIEIARTGMTALSRGPKSINIEE